MFLSVITAPIVLVLIINFLNRGCNVNRMSTCKFDPPRLFQIWIRPRQYYWRCYGLTLLAKICSTSPICRDNAYSKSCSKRKRKYWVLERNGTFIFKITPNRHNGRQNLNYCILPHPPLFSLPSTFNELSARTGQNLIKIPPPLPSINQLSNETTFSQTISMDSTFKRNLLLIFF
jgi:hypothetical protein